MKKRSGKSRKRNRSEREKLLLERLNFEEEDLLGCHDSQEVSGGFLPGIHRFSEDNLSSQNKIVSQ